MNIVRNVVEYCTWCLPVKNSFVICEQWPAFQLIKRNSEDYQTNTQQPRKNQYVFVRYIWIQQWLNCGVHPLPPHPHPTFPSFRMQWRFQDLSCGMNSLPPLPYIDPSCLKRLRSTSGKCIETDDAHRLISAQFRHKTSSFQTLCFTLQLLNFQIQGYLWQLI